MILTQEEIAKIVADALTDDQRGETCSLPICANRLNKFELYDLLSTIDPQRKLWVKFDTSPPFEITLEALRKKDVESEERNNFYYNLCRAAMGNVTSP